MARIASGRVRDAPARASRGEVSRLPPQLEARGVGGPNDRGNALVTSNQLAKSIIDIRERPMRRMAFSRV